MTPEPTPSQTVGPFFHFALLEEDQSKLVSPDHPSAIRIGGTVYDGAGEVVPDAMLEIWQANAAGRYAHPEDAREDLPLDENFSGFGRCGTDANGRYSFLLPPATRHVAVMVFARGLLKPVVTRMYVPGETDAEDESMLAQREDGGRLRFDVHLQGERETAFFEL